MPLGRTASISFCVCPVIAAFGPPVIGVQWRTGGFLRMVGWQFAIENEDVFMQSERLTPHIEKAAGFVFLPDETVSVHVTARNHEVRREQSLSGKDDGSVVFDDAAVLMSSRQFASNTLSLGKTL